MNFFVPVENGYVLLRSRGVYKQAQLFERGASLYAKWGSGFISLMNFQKATSNSNVAWVEINVKTMAGTTGLLEISSAEEAK